MKGKTAKEVAEIVGLSERTVNYHAGEAIYRLSCTNKHQAVLKAITLGLLGVDL